MDQRDPREKERDGPTCSVNSTFNYSVGAVSVAAGIALIWLGWRFLGG